MKWFLDDVEQDSLCYYSLSDNLLKSKKYKVLKTKFKYFDLNYTQEFLKEFPEWDYDGEWYTINLDNIPTKKWFLFTVSILRYQEEWPRGVNAFNQIRTTVPYLVRIHMCSFGNEKNGHMPFHCFYMRFNPKLLVKKDVLYFLKDTTQPYNNMYFKGKEIVYDETPYTDYRKYRDDLSAYV